MKNHGETYKEGKINDFINHITNNPEKISIQEFLH